MFSINGNFFPTGNNVTFFLIARARNANLSHITTGYIDNFPSGAFVRVGEAYEGQISWSSFDYSNVSESGLVDNTLTTYGWNSTTPSVWRGYVNSNFPIFRDDILVEAGAVYEGLIRRDFVPSPVAAVRDLCHIDFFSVNRRVDHLFSGVSCTRVPFP